LDGFFSFLAELTGMVRDYVGDYRNGGRRRERIFVSTHSVPAGDGEHAEQKSPGLPGASL
jgi:hypothetical protein